MLLAMQIKRNWRETIILHLRWVKLNWTTNEMVFYRNLNREKKISFFSYLPWWEINWVASHVKYSSISFFKEQVVIFFYFSIYCNLSKGKVPVYNILVMSGLLPERGGEKEDYKALPKLASSEVDFIMPNMTRPSLWKLQQKMQVFGIRIIYRWIGLPRLHVCGNVSCFCNKQCSAEAAIPREYRGSFSKVEAETP